jgi:uncharacterized protein with HEPN domain
MSSPRIYLHYLEDILGNAAKALEFVKGMSESEFLQDDKTIFAVIRALEVMGEAAKNVPDDIRNKYSHIPWRDLAGMRDKLIHHYFGVDLKTVWKTVNRDLPILCPKLEEVWKRESQGT